MTRAPTRRSLVAAVGAALALPAQAQPSANAWARHALAALEAQHGGRLGVVSVDTGSGRSIRYRAAERFAMCSTHKFLTTAAALALVDQGGLALDRRVPYGRADLLEYAPVTRKNVDAGFMTVDALCAAAIEWSDNTAANLLLGLVGGPAGWTRYARAIGDTVSRLDRTELALNAAVPGDPRDTTTPAAMACNLQAVLRGQALSDASRSRLQAMMLGSKVTADLLQAGLPNGWRVGDKSGSGGHGTRNDVGIILPPEAAPILAAVYYTGTTEPISVTDHVIAEVGRIIVKSVGH